MDQLTKLHSKGYKRIKKITGLFHSKQYTQCLLFTISCLPHTYFATSVFIVLLSKMYRYDALFYLLGYLANKEVNSRLKLFFAQARPAQAGTHEADGMPSCHAQIAFFTALAIHAFGYTAYPWFYAAAIAIACTRYLLGKHTVAQIVAGSGVGVCLGYGFMILISCKK